MLIRRERRGSFVIAALSLLLASLLATSAHFAQAAVVKPKLLVLTDIGGDPDDQQSMTRLMAHSNEFEIVGLIATSRMGHGQDTKLQYIQEVINAYGQAQPNFAKHASGYVPASQLLAVAKAGTSVYDQYGDIFKAIGLGKSTAASNHIISVIDAAAADNPVNVSIWGGAADLAQALYDVRRTRSAAQVDEFLSHMRVHASYDQDGTGTWINQNFPQLHYVLSADVQYNGNTIAYSAPLRGMYQNDTRSNTGKARQVVPDAQLGLTARPWVDANITSHGPLGAVYPSGPTARYKDGIWQNPANGSFVHNSAGEGQKEGDSPTWLYFMPNGLNIADDPTFGGWGGRFQKADTASTADFYVAARDKHWSGYTDVGLESVWTVARYREAIQNEFAARMDWAVTTTYAGANHAPQSPLEGLYSYNEITVGDDQRVSLSGDGWTDPDGNALTYRWWFYAEPSTQGVLPTLVDASSMNLLLDVPDVDQVSQLHLILEVTDQPRSGLVPMTRYQRVLLTVNPAHVPEPSTFVLAGVGLLGLLFLSQRRKRL